MAAASVTGGEVASWLWAAESMEIGNDPARMVRPSNSMALPDVAAPASCRASRTKLRAPPGNWKPIRSAPSSPVITCVAPRQPDEQLDRRERDVQEEADPDVRPQLPQHPGHQLQLVVVHPDGRAGGGDVRRALREPPVDLPVGVPPLPVELGVGHGVVVERPEGGVGEALVVGLDLVGADSGTG